MRISTRSQNRVRSCQNFLNDKIATDTLLEIELIILSVAVGINDATTYTDYRVFASNQTGNTALLAVGALGLVNKSILDLTNIGVSLGFFIIGGTVLGQLGHRVGSTRRFWLLFTNIFQTVLVLLCAALRKWVARNDHSSERYAVIALLAFASGAQVAVARTVNVPEITTAMITSAYIDFTTDPKLFARHNRPRDRRLFFILAIIAGSFIGAAAYKKVEAAFALLLSGICKTSICVLLFFNQPETPSPPPEVLCERQVEMPQIQTTSTQSEGDREDAAATCDEAV